MSHQISLLESQKHHSNNSLREAHDRLVAIQKQFEARPSRAEDVECMNSLRDRLATADTYIKTLNDDNLNSKLELANRERNFNQIFSNSGAAHATVGVVDPLHRHKGGGGRQTRIINQSRKL
eukprot:GHVR01005737.1.p1 GENE.GHVR01005737.1~~GHVR01005737.1.p1  ORF type:complete len:122 (-),score=24.88 GHVR01005737.1:45-410(-)